jgi:hypothetical protein
MRKFLPNKKQNGLDRYIEEALSNREKIENLNDYLNRLMESA